MIIVYLNRPDYEYDIHSLIKAFFPKEDVELYYTCPLSGEGERNVACMHRGAETLSREQAQAASHILTVDYRERAISLLWEGGAFGRVEFPVDYPDRTATKNALKQHLYRLLTQICGKELPWGALTGIRPTKIARKLLDEGADEEQVFSHMKDTYFASDGKISLALEIAGRERACLARVDYRDGYSLYVGIPFCPSTCLYCSFTSYPLAAWSGRVDEYLDALGREIDYAAEHFQGRGPNTVYIGGGTPTTLEPRQLDRLLGKLRDSFDLGDCPEFTVEAGRPDSVTREKLLVLREHGIGRISINPQTMKQQTLDLIGRRHTVEQTVESFYLARELGFSNINMDLIVGLPDESLADVRHTMERLAQLGPDNITVHSLAVKRASRLNIDRERYEQMQMINSQEHMQLCADYCRDMGLFPYYLYRQKGMAGNMENVGYARDGTEGLYNILMMEEVQSIVALGAGSSSKRVYPDGTIRRCENVKEVARYIDNIDEMIDRKRKLFEKVPV